MARQAIADKRAHMARIAHLARDKLTAEPEAKASAERLAGSDQQLANAQPDGNLARDELPEAKKDTAQAIASAQHSGRRPASPRRR